MNKELMEALNILEKEKEISKETLFEAIENSLLTACKNHFGKADNIKVNINPDTGDFSVFAEKEVVETVEDPLTQICVEEAKLKNPRYIPGDIVPIPVQSKEFGRIATQNAKMSFCRRSGRRSARSCTMITTARKRILSRALSRKI